MEHDRRKTIAVHLTVRLSVSSGQMHAKWRSLKERAAKAIRRGIVRFVLFWLTHLTGRD